MEGERALSSDAPGWHCLCHGQRACVHPAPPTCGACCSKILQLGIRLFAGVSLLVLATVLPVNLTGGQVRMGGCHCRAGEPWNATAHQP